MTDTAEQLDHLEQLQRRAGRLLNQLVVARDRVAELERQHVVACQLYALAIEQYHRDAARPLSEA
jgi:hypothetical protein